MQSFLLQAEGVQITDQQYISLEHYQYQMQEDA
jgi:methylated-DNA-protein-cysteine methyltransferase-like protein